MTGQTGEWTERDKQRERESGVVTLPHYLVSPPHSLKYFMFSSPNPCFPEIFLTAVAWKNACGEMKGGATPIPPLASFFFLLLWFGAKENRQIKLISLHQSSPPAKFFFCRGKKRKKEKRPRSRLCLRRLALCSPVVCSLAVRPCPTSCPTCHVLANATSLFASITSCFLSNSTLIYTNSQQFGHPRLV